MSTENLIPFRRFANKELAESYLEIFQKNGIQCRMGDNLPSADLTFSNSTVTNQFEILLPEEEFEKAERLMLDLMATEIENLPEDYYLYEFEDEELKEILIHPQEWNELDQLLAKKLIEERGLDFSQEEVEEIQKEEIKKVQKTDQTPIARILFCYVFIILAFFFKLLLIFLVFMIAQGYILWNSKRKLPDGDQIPQYNETTRLHGQIIFYFGILIAILSVAQYALILFIGPETNFMPWR